MTKIIRVGTKRGMTQNHSRSAKETREAIKELLDKGVSPRQICDQLQIGYSTVMKYRREIMNSNVDVDNNGTDNKLEKVEQFTINNSVFEVRTLNKGQNTLYNLNDLSVYLGKYGNVDSIEKMVRKTFENGEEYIHENYLLPIANMVKDYNFTEQVKSILFENVNCPQTIIIKSYLNAITKFIKGSNQDKLADLLEEQRELLERLDDTRELQELTAITSEIKKVRNRAKELTKEDEFRDNLNQILSDKEVDIETICQNM